jgi:hypothetical protein
MFLLAESNTHPRITAAQEEAQKPSDTDSNSLQPPVKVMHLALICERI